VFFGAPMAQRFRATSGVISVSRRTDPAVHFVAIDLGTGPGCSVVEGPRYEQITVAIVEWLKLLIIYDNPFWCQTGGRYRLAKGKVGSYHSPVIRRFLVVDAILLALASGTLLIVSSARAQRRATGQYFPKIQERQRRSDIVCLATIIGTRANGSVVLEGEERSQWLATAHVDRVTKGHLPHRVIQFKYYGLGPTSQDYFRPSARAL
jgi:hypothetical protein